MTITVTSLPLNNATKPALVGLLTASNPSDAASNSNNLQFQPNSQS